MPRSRTVLVAALLAFLASAVAHAAAPPFRLGLTHGQRSLDPWASRAAVDAGRELLAASPGTLQNQHIMGWGAANPEPVPGSYRWSSLDRRMELVRATHGTPVITLCCAPDWMKGGVPGTTDWARLDAAPATTSFDEFARLAAAVARRYPDVHHFLVWNEMKGFWDPVRNRWRYEDYTRLYNKVYVALKAVSPAIQVGGPYVPMISWRPDVGGGRDSAVRGPWGMVDQRALDAVDYWLAHAVGADFVAVDGNGSLQDGTFLVPPMQSLAKLAAVDDWLRSRTALPIWWAEVSPIPFGTSGRYTPAAEASLWGATVETLARSGAAAALLWQAESSRGHTGLWTSVSTATGGRPTLVHDAVARSLG